MINEIQKFDYDRYLSLIFAPKELREDIMAIVLFNLEIARIKSKVSEPMMGMIRLQWWREAIDEIYDESRTPRRHEVVRKINDVVDKYPKIEKDDLLTIINAREKDLDENPFNTTAEFYEYLEATSYPVNKMMLDILDTHDSRIFAATKEMSMAWAICSIMRAAYRNFSTNRSVFPADMMERHGILLSDFGKPGFVERSKGVVKELCEIAEIKFTRAEEILNDVPKAERSRAVPVLLNLRTTKHHLKQIEKNEYDVFTKNMNPHLGFLSLIKIYLGF